MLQPLYDHAWDLREANLQLQYQLAAKGFWQLKV